jgi:hypothetical protein
VRARVLPDWCERSARRELQNRLGQDISLRQAPPLSLCQARQSPRSTNNEQRTSSQPATRRLVSAAPRLARFVDSRFSIGSRVGFQLPARQPAWLGRRLAAAHEPENLAELARRWSKSLGLWQGSGKCLSYTDPTIWRPFPVVFKSQMIFLPAPNTLLEVDTIGTLVGTGTSPAPIVLHPPIRPPARAPRWDLTRSNLVDRSSNPYTIVAHYEPVLSLVPQQTCPVFAPNTVRKEGRCQPSPGPQGPGGQAALRSESLQYAYTCGKDAYVVLRLS